MPYLEKEEMDALLGTPDRRQPQGSRDYAILLFLYNTGARAQEAADVTVGDLNLDSSPCVRIRGKGSKTRICPLWGHTVKVLRSLLSHRVSEPPETPMFLNIRGKPFTRFGIHTLVERTVVRAVPKLPSLQAKRISPHTVRHYLPFLIMSSSATLASIHRRWRGAKQT